MGFKKSWDVVNIINQVHSLSRECDSRYNDGFTAFGCKQDLLLIKEIVDQAMQSAPHFGTMEDEWLQEREKKRIIKILKS
jgi:hypothetical protein